MSENYDTLVLSGGSSKGLVILGALQYGYDNYLLDEIKTYIGTSAGAITCFLLAIGYTPMEIISYICTNQLMEKLQHFNLVAMINNLGALSFTSIYEQLEKMTIDKIGYLPTFTDLHQKMNKTLICVTYNLTLNQTEYLSFDTTPDLPCLIALKMSSNLPLIFENFKYGSYYYIDGGVTDNFAIDKGDSLGKKVLGIYIDPDKKDDYGENNNELNIIKYIYTLMFIPISQTIKYKLQQISERCHVIKLTHDKTSLFDFNINSVEKLEMFSSGYQQTKEIFEI
jgi:predicted acylesterase/phospholipase RssA